MHQHPGTCLNFFVLTMVVLVPAEIIGCMQGSPAGAPVGPAPNSGSQGPAGVSLSTPTPTSGPGVDPGGTGFSRIVGGEAKASVLPDGTRGPISSSRDLQCTFGLPCRWHNVNEGDQLQWLKGTGRANAERWRASTGTDIQPTDPYAVIQPDSVGSFEDKGHLVSDVVPCLNGNGELSFKYWTSPNVQLKACTRPQGSSTVDFCSPAITTGDPGPAFITIPGPKPHPFEIIIEAKGFITKDEFAVIDDIDFNAQFCSNPTFAGTQAPIPGAYIDKGVCPLLKCNFDPGTDCSQATQSNSQWLLAAGQIGNRNTGVPGDPINPAGSYAYVEGPTQLSTLDFPAISLSQPKQLKFYYYKASIGSDLSIRSSNGNSIFQAPTVDKNSRQWFQQSVTIPAGQNQKLQIAAENLRPHQYIAMDNLQLLNLDGSPFC